ncbi:PTPRJ phosphatase, partial [Polypterus senegalus]
MVVETSRIFWTNYSSINVTDLNPATNYTFRVTAVALDYQTEGSSATIIQYTLPNVIMNPTSVALTTSSISLSWSPPKGGSVTYKVYLLNNGTVVLTNISSINVTGLMPATSYQFSVSAVAQDHKTEGNNVTITQYTKPGKVEQLNTTTITATSILLSWYQAQGVNISYKIIVLDQQSYSSTFYTSNSSFNVAGLSSGTSFSFNVTALAADNATEGYPNTITGCTSPPVPSGPLNVNIQEKTYQTVKFSFKSFSNENGNINAYAVIVTSNTGSTTPNNLSLSKTYTDYSSGNTDSYVTAIITQSSEEPSVTIGDGTSYYDYKNNVLAATKSYRNIPVKIENYEDYYHQQTANENCGFAIEYEHLGENRNIRHFHFTAWPDHGVPETTDLLIKFRDLVRDYMNLHSRNSPTIIHCSAGVGRTGTLIALDHLILQIEKEGIADVYGIVYGLRMHRPLMVQTEDQYVFLNRCALDIIRSKDFSNSDLIYQNTAALGIYENFVPNFKRENGYRC